jgi:hypothetical protein
MVSIFDLQALYKTYFNTSPYYISPKGSEKSVTQDIVYSGISQNPSPKGTIYKSKDDIAFNKIGAYGQDIWFPIEFWIRENKTLEIEACTVAVNLSKTIIKTAVSERKGTVHEIFGVDDYKFTIKGFLIDKNRTFPEDQINKLKEIFETTEPVSLHGGYPELFLDESCGVVIATLDFPEVQGKSPWIRPFSMTCESDFISDIENLIIK